jgi:hypothetical protein
MFYFFQPYLIVLAILTGMLVLVFAASRFATQKPALSHLLFLFATAVGFAFLGLTVGIFVGNSRESAVNTTISAAMTFMGAMVVYLFTKKDSSTVNFSLKLSNSFFVAIICLISFPINLLYGALIGGANRRDSEVYDKSIEFDYQTKLKANEYALKATEDSIQAFLGIYKDTVTKNAVSARPSSH